MITRHSTALSLAVALLSLTAIGCGRDVRSMTVGELASLPQAEQLELLSDLTLEERGILEATRIKAAGDTAYVYSLTVQQVLDVTRSRGR